MEWTRKGFKHRGCGRKKYCLAWSQFILECGLRMASDDGDHHVEGDKSNNKPADDKAGLPEGAFEALMLPLLPFSLKVHQVVRIVCLILLKFCSSVLG